MAQRVLEGFISDKVVAVTRVKDVVVDFEKCLAAYAASVQDSFWASFLEIHDAAMELNIAVVYRHKDHSVLLGQGKVMGAVSLRNSHFVSVRLKKSKITVNGKPHPLRAGIQGPQNRRDTSATFEIQAPVSRVIRSVELDISQYDNVAVVWIIWQTSWKRMTASSSLQHGTQNKRSQSGQVYRQDTLLCGRDMV